MTIQYAPLPTVISVGNYTILTNGRWDRCYVDTV